MYLFNKLLSVSLCAVGLSTLDTSGYKNPLTSQEATAISFKPYWRFVNIEFKGPALQPPHGGYLLAEKSSLEDYYTFWEKIPVGDDTYLLKNFDTGMYISINDERRLVVYADAEPTAFQVIPVANANDTYIIKVPDLDLVWEPRFQGSSDFGVVMLTPDNGSNSQRWQSVADDL
ncbi:hypothetical protein B0H16DRAFT_1559449 [Mycena metata]|uniref:Uncharacterized protein n=1 Tax=Mycena metata TaxID=1033252 RepID=A0AAD7N469_9AGAR|nr:hypothetical protein B0H16DRAFT_1649752 [Mycena metata]KAJ7744908.1 hypothetical protein B0H16DRAFT_1559449 [Mycena metata]